MSSEPLASLRGVSKLFRIYRRPEDRLRQLFSRAPLYTEFWPLRDVSLDLFPAETVGLIGRNGSGKSTLLRIAAGIMEATAGEVAVRGRISAILELGAAFDPEFTGRENARLSAAVMGIPRRDVEGALERMIAFADLGPYIDQPVKFYSTGMHMRLAFAVAIFVEPDILIIDEALAVGDAAFQEKCMDRLRQLQSRGVAILLTSHEAPTIQSFCHRAILLDQGRIRAQGAPASVLEEYRRVLHPG